MDPVTSLPEELRKELLQTATVKEGVIYFPIKNCTACNKETRDLYSRTLCGKEYCVVCLNRGAGIQEYYDNGIGNLVSAEMRKRALENGFLKEASLNP